MKRLGVVLVGLGPGSRPHIASLAELGTRVDVRWAVTRRPEQADLGALTGYVSATADLDRALADPDVDVAIVATPASTHLDIVRKCFEAGKHTLVEKPLEISLDRAEALVSFAQSTDRCFGVVLQHRFRPGAITLRQVLANHELGDIEAASVRVPWWRPQAGYYDQPGRGTKERDGGGVLLTQAIHAIDLFRSLVGVRGVVAAQATTTAVHRMETEDYAAALLTLGNGTPGTLTATTAMYPGGPECIEIIGRLGTAVLEGGGLEVAFHDGRHIAVPAEGGSGGGANIMDFPPDAHRALISDFLDAVEHGRAPMVSGQEALATHRLIEEVLAKSGFKPR